MLQIFKGKEDKLAIINEFESGCWVNVSKPTKEELNELVDKLKIPLDLLTDPLDINERARIEIEDGNALIVLRVPQFQKDEVTIPFVTLPVGIVLVHDIIVTVCLEDIEVIADFVEGKIKGFSTENRGRFILQLFLEAGLLYLQYLNEINNRTSRVEKELQKAMKNEELIKLLNLEKSLVYFTTSLKSNELMMERLQKMGIIEISDKEEGLLDDVIVENRQAIELANIYSNILSGMMDAFASIISNNLGVVMKFLTAITIILMIPTLVASTYGMNVVLPFQRSPHAFATIILLAVALTAIGTLIFMRRKWF